jgi:hypothetical protein
LKSQNFQKYKEQLKINHAEKVEELSQLYLKNLTVENIAKLLNKSPSYISYRICQLRKKYPDKFPLKHVRA